MAKINRNLFWVIIQAVKNELVDIYSLTPTNFDELQELTKLICYFKLIIKK